MATVENSRRAVGVPGVLLVPGADALRVAGFLTSAAGAALGPRAAA